MAGLNVGFTDQSLLALHSQVSEKLGETQMASLDRQLPTVDYTRHQVGKGTAGHDQVLQSNELFEAVTTRPELHAAYQKFSGEALPWIPSKNPLNQSLLKKFDEMVRDWRSENPTKDKHSPELAKEILIWVLKPRPEGMGMKPEELGPEWNFDRAVKEGKGNCSELTFILLTLYERAGFKVHAEWVGIDMHGASAVHVTPGVEIKGRTYLVDAVYGNGTFDAPHKFHTPITKTQLLGFYWHNRGLYEDQYGNKKLALEFYQKAEAVDPFNPYIYYNRGLLYLQIQGFTDNERVKKAEGEFRKALKIDPDFPPALVELGGLYDRRRDYRQALVYIRRSLNGDPQDRMARVYLVQALGGLGRFAEAKKELKTLQDEIPTNSPPLKSAPVHIVAAWLDSQMKKQKAARKTTHISKR